MLNRRQIAEAYKHAPLVGPGAARAWSDLADETERLADSIVRPLFAVTITDDAEPYARVTDMLNDIEAGRITVSRANSEHPLWTVEQNINFRLVHDVLGHGLTRADFSWQGEVEAYEEHLRLVESPWAKAALFTEALAQVAYAIENNGFGAQKCALLPTWMQFADVAVRLTA
jgi:hypothetical protein